MDEIVQYIIEFLLYGNKEAAKQVAYNVDPTKCYRYRVCIQANGHLGKDWVLPNLSGDSRSFSDSGPSAKSGPVVFTTDIIYNTAFFISRAEELINPQRDEHGRLCAKHSILGQDLRLMHPIIDEYSRVLMQALGLELPRPGFAAINLTHDIDVLDHYRHLRGALGGIRRGQFKEVIAAWRDIDNDPAYTFDWLMEQDLKVKQHHPETQMIYFVKHTTGKGYDYPQYNLQGKDFRRLSSFLTQQGAILGLHSSYYKLSTNQLDGFSTLYTLNSKLHRSHFLRCDIQRLQQLVEAGVTDDYSMGFADHIGFSMGTCRSFRWIDPIHYRLTNLTIHPLAIMDNTLSDEQYMNLNPEKALEVCQQTIQQVRQYRGELNLLWHNTTVNQPYHSLLYNQVINYLCSL